jgi:antitoxin component YwqK of YwqJK toxin-antitoxin module
MKRLLYILALIFFIGCSEDDRIEIIEAYSNGDPLSVKVYSNDNNSNYIIKDYYIDGTLVFEGKVVNEKFVEYKKAYFENGTPKEIVELTDSADLDYCCPNGFYQTYYDNGQLSETHYKKNGLFNGLVTKYDSSGIKSAEYEVTNDLKNGITKTFYLNGEIKSIKEYQQDTLIKTVYYFTETGDSLKRHGTYNGKLDFPIKYWKENGSSLLGEYLFSKANQVKWTWKDSINNTLKTEIADPVNGQFITPVH